MDGSESAIVFVHGLGGSIYSWWPQLDACEAAGLRALAYDQRGAGLTAKPPGPYSVAMGDFNGDGKPDLAVTSRDDNAVSVLLGNGDGTFQAPIEYATDSFPVHVATADFNGDGKLDLAVANSALSDEPPSVSILLGNGDGTFQAAVNQGAGISPRSLAAGDFDPDAYAEWAAATAPAEMIAPQRVACPALVACGEHDPVAPPAAAEAIAAALPNARVTVIEGAAHWCQLEAPQAVSDALLRFVREVAT